MRKALATAVLATSALLAVGTGPSYAGTDYAEDHPLFNCTTMGNHTCGLGADESVRRPPAHCWSLILPPTPYRPVSVEAWYMSNGGPHDRTNPNATLCEEEHHVLTDEEREAL